MTLILLFVQLSCTKANLKLTVSGVVLRDGKPTNGTVRIFNLKDMLAVGESKTMQEGKFLIREIPPGEYIIGLTSRTGGIIGKYHYLKVGRMGSARDFVFDISKEDPKAIELMSKFNQKTTD
jgi:hypothetical protein